MEYKRVCRMCRYVRYIGGGVWVCSMKEEVSKNIMMEVHPLQKGCDLWELRALDSSKVEDKILGRRSNMADLKEKRDSIQKELQDKVNELNMIEQRKQMLVNEVLILQGKLAMLDELIQEEGGEKVVLEEGGDVKDAV